jgi:hypothetical protein
MSIYFPDKMIKPERQSEYGTNGNNGIDGRRGSS